MKKIYTRYLCYTSMVCMYAYTGIYVGPESTTRNRFLSHPHYPTTNNLTSIWRALSFPCDLLSLEHRHTWRLQRRQLQFLPWRLWTRNNRPTQITWATMEDLPPKTFHQKTKKKKRRLLPPTTFREPWNAS